MLRIEQNGEGLGIVIEFEAVEGTPLCRNRMPVCLDAFEHPTKTHGLGIE